MGEAFIYLSNGDQWRYRRFLDSSWRTEGDDSVTMKEDKELDRAALETRTRDSKQNLRLRNRDLLMEEHRETGLLRDFELI